MSTKTSAAQPPGRRTPLSLNAAKQNNKQTNDNKKETNANNQKTENPKKDLAAERKPSTDRRQNSASDSRKASTSDSKKPEEAKTAKNVDNKKNQNGVSANGVKNSNEGASKTKLDASAASVPTTPKKEDDKATEKKDVAKETKNETNDKSKTDDKNKEKTPADKKDVTEQKKVVDKTSEEKITPSKKGGDAAEKVVEIINLESSDEKKTTGRSPGRPRKNEDAGTTKPVGKGKKVEETKKTQEKPVQPPAEELDDDIMMEPLAFDPEPPAEIFAASTPAKNLSRSGETTPKVSPKSEIKASRASHAHTPDRNSCPRSFSSISGRRSIRPIGDYTFSGNLQIRESYRKINTELDFTSSSMNVTVGSEVPNNDSFSFFSRSRKRERPSPINQSAMEVQGDISPKSPKRARIDLGMSGFFTVMASPITMLRARLSRASVQSTPKKEPEVVEVVPIEEDIVENVSGVSVEEETTATEDFTVNPDSTVDTLPTDGDDPKIEESAECSEKPSVDGLKHDDDIQIKEIITTTDSQAKKKCSIM